MNPAHTRFAQWDAAYLIGALSAADRAAYEAHLSECGQCRRAVAELAPTVGLLGRVDADAVAASGEPTIGAVPDAAAEIARARFLRRARAGRRRMRWATAAAAALVLVLAAIAAPTVLSWVQRPAAAIALHEVSGATLQASVRLTGTPWGTRIDLDCRYPAGYPGQSPASHAYALAVVGVDGSTSLVSTWRIGPGAAARLSAGTAWAPTQIRAIEIRSAQGQVLMRRTLPAASG